MKDDKLLIRQNRLDELLLKEKQLEKVKEFLSGKRDELWWNPDATDKTDQTCKEILELLDTL